METNHYFILYKEGNEEEPMRIKKESNLCVYTCVCSCIWPEMLFLLPRTSAAKMKDCKFFWT